MGMYLGCRHDVSEKVLPDTGARVRCIEYNMEDFLRSCVERYKELTGVTAMRHAATPFLTLRARLLQYRDTFANNEFSRRDVARCAGESE